MVKSKRTKRIAGVALAGAGLLAVLTACDDGSEYQGDGDFGRHANYRVVEFDGNRLVDCLFIGKGQSRMMSCDWSTKRNAK